MGERGISADEMDGAQGQTCQPGVSQFNDGLYDGFYSDPESQSGYGFTVSNGPCGALKNLNVAT